ncbi:protein FAR-RED IMPAIRED RESPONSE 1-like [Argentina anserina]|uniref:protein FAR-RED IMPAIRED RESPONSE 1-like n=1 Tax=Argentina anserina TaxID=57926 RepID=UPI0021766BE2|nr:protein FAR-RED IMPAIRED RESPONSE 1-like [Potentilla anserina]
MEQLSDESENIPLLNEQGTEIDDSSKSLDNNQEEEGKDIMQEPNVEMSFNYIDEAFEYYRKYGKQSGFPVKKRTSRKGDDGSTRYVTISCGRAGKFKSTTSNSLKPRPSVKTDCNALIRLGKSPDGKWKINYVKLEHNHGFSPRKSRYFVVNRGLSSSIKRRLELNDVAKIGTNKSYNSIVVEARGYENVPFLEKDARNHIEKMRRLRLKEGDASAVQTYFLDMQAKNVNFFYAIDINEKGRLRNLFWADARSRAAYHEFGDVITFDTTFLTNKYEMPFAPFVGVNHHGQSILLGCGLISSEDKETFVWLFKSWLACMFGNALGGIITDQDRAMRNAIEIVFPNTRHRWCLWHILKKLPEKLKGYAKYESISITLLNTVYNSLSRIEFEERWDEMIKKYELQKNDW